MASKIQLRRDTAANWASVNPVLASGEIGFVTDTNKFKIGDGTTAFNSLAFFNGNLTGSVLDDLSDVTITSAASGDFLKWNGSAWVNDPINLATDTTGDYVSSLVAGSGITITNNSGEGSTPTVELSDIATNQQTSSYTLVLSDKNKMVEMNVGSANNVTVPPNSSAAFPVGTQITVLQVGTGQTTVVAGSGVTVNATPGLKLRAQWSSATLVKRATNTWVALGDLQA
jgi:hypothetical protein